MKTDRDRERERERQRQKKVDLPERAQRVMRQSEELLEQT